MGFVRLAAQPPYNFRVEHERDVFMHVRASASLACSSAT